jgi:hypothetical protein
LVPTLEEEGQVFKLAPRENMATSAPDLVNCHFQNCNKFCKIAMLKIKDTFRKIPKMSIFFSAFRYIVELSVELMYNFVPSPSSFKTGGALIS